MMVLPCPECPAEIEVSEEDPDGSLTDLWHHLAEHAFADDDRTALFIRAQQNAATR
jgi:hypothetical protein